MKISFDISTRKTEEGLQNDKEKRVFDYSIYESFHIFAIQDSRIS
jgi:hypothetical protein